jgi:hypothetical protein
MDKRGLKCRDLAAGLAGGVSVESYIETAAGNCLIGITERATHVVKIRTCSLLPFQLTLSADCESPYLRYDDTNTEWSAHLLIEPSTHKSKNRERTVRIELTCVGEFVDQGIRMTVNYEFTKYMGTGAASMQLLLDTTKQ